MAVRPLHCTVESCNRLSPSHCTLVGGKETDSPPTRCSPPPHAWPLLVWSRDSHNQGRLFLAMLPKCRLQGGPRRATRRPAAGGSVPLTLVVGEEGKPRILPLQVCWAAPPVRCGAVWRQVDLLEWGMRLEPGDRHRSLCS